MFSKIIKKLVLKYHRLPIENEGIVQHLAHSGQLLVIAACRITTRRPRLASILVTRWIC